MPLLLSLITLRNMRCGYFFELPYQDDFNKCPHSIVPRVLNAVFLNVSYYLSHLRIRFIQNVVMQILLYQMFIYCYHSFALFNHSNLAYLIKTS